MPPPRGTSEIEDFDPLVHLELEEEKPEGEEEEEEEEDENKPVVQLMKTTIPNIEKFWLRMDPEENDYIEVIVRTFSSGLD